MMQERNNLRPTNVPADDTRPLGEIVSDLWHNTQVLVRQELTLGLAEIDQRVDTLKGDLTRVTVGGAVLYAGVLSLVAALVMALAKVMDGWLAALITGVVVGVVGFALLWRGKQRMTHASPKQDDTAIGRGHAMREALK
jgi:hypothetical protein